MTQPKKSEGQARKCHCPYCEEELIVADSPFCRGCGVALVRCDACGQVMATTITVCPHCGAKIKGNP
ncbi:MAG: zinc ribbon domain-containing protein [Chloroflexota bacterium]